MNLIKEFLNWFASPKADACCALAPDVTPVETEEIKESCGDLFESMCRDAGVKQEWLDARNAISIFEDWYTGTCDAAEIKASINDFINANPTFRAKLKGKFQNELLGARMMAKTQAFIDGWLAKLTSRKLMVWATATTFTFTGHITRDDWVIISAIYIGGQTVIDGIARLKGYND